MDLGNQLCVALLETGGLDQMTSRHPCQPQPFSDSVIYRETGNKKNKKEGKKKEQDKKNTAAK